MKNYDVIIVGGGASGSICAIKLAGNNKKVLVIDKNDLPAKKLLVTGNGRCNITNKDIDCKFYNQDVQKFFDKFDNFETIKFFESIGIDTYFDNEGRAYPTSNSAKSVQIAIINQFKKLGIDFLANHEVIHIEADTNNQGEYFVNVVGHESKDVKTYFAKNIVVSFGGGKVIENFAKEFKVDAKPSMPSLVALKTKQSTKHIEGVRVSDVLMTANVDGKTQTEIGEVLFKDCGLSGICIFNLSSYFARLEKFEGKIAINLKKDLKNAEIYEKINKKLNIFENVLDLLTTMFDRKLAKEILFRCDIDVETSCKKLAKQDIESIVKEMTNFEFDVVGHYDNNQVFSGGVLLNQLTDELESNSHKGLFFCGEAANVDGVCGGYNLQWAWTSGSIVANKINKKQMM